MSDQPSPLSRILKREFAVLSVLLFLGIVILPVAVWFVGNAVFGAYGGAGYGDFFGILTGKLRAGDLVAWFLVLSPWLALTVIRLAVFGWRNTRKM